MTGVTADEWLRRRSGTAPAGVDEDDEEPADGYRAYSLARSPGRQVFMLEFRSRDGSSTALGYAWLRSARFDPSAGITLQFTDGQVRLRGRHLHALFTAVMAYRARWVWEADRPTAALVPESDPVVTEIVLSDGEREPDR